MTRQPLMTVGCLMDCTIELGSIFQSACCVLQRGIWHMCMCCACRQPGSVLLASPVDDGGMSTGAGYATAAAVLLGNLVQVGQPQAHRQTDSQAGRQADAEI
jgi:hypothetical protein